MRGQLIITVDYELPAGGTGDPLRHMIEPTAELMQACERRGARLTIMAEMAELWAMEHPANHAYREALGYDAAGMIRRQLVDAIRRGHDVQLHLHPQWLRAVWRNGAWALDYAHYQLGDLCDDEMVQALRKGREDLEALLEPHAKGYACVAFRAGHWNTSPSDRYLAALRAAGLRCDTSVFKWGHANNNMARFDYRNAFDNVHPWRADSRDINKSSMDGSIIEIPIASIKVGLLGMLTLKRLRQARNYWREERHIKNAIGITIEDKFHDSIPGKIRRFLGSHSMKLDFGKLTPGQMMKMAQKLLKQCPRGNDEQSAPLVMIGHSKQHGAAKDLDAFLGELTEKYGGRIGFTTLNEYVATFEATENIVPDMPVGFVGRDSNITHGRQSSDTHISLQTPKVPRNPRRIHIDQCPVDCLNHSEALSEMMGAVRNGHCLRIAPVNASTVVEARRKPELRAALAAMDLLLPDGFYLQWAAQLAGLPSPSHVPTVPLALALLGILAKEKGRVFLLGARPDVVRMAGEHLAKRFPGLAIAGVRDGYFGEIDEDNVVREINAAKPQALLIGISSPKRDLFMERQSKNLSVPVVIGVGGLIDILSGNTAEGPNWLRKIGMMWVYRLLQEPRRMWKRYTVTNSIFIALAFRGAIRRIFS